jgi:hypothetical protein
MLTAEFPEFLTELERTVIDFLLREDSEDNRVLRRQIADSSLESREHNGYGIYTHFQIASDAQKCTNENFELGDVSVVLSAQLCGFILFVRGGKIAFLEGFPLGGDEWPSPEIIEKVSRFQSC